MEVARPHLKHPPVRNVDIGGLQDTFLVSAVATILVIRLQLWLTNYPQLGGGKLHIAHLLWGGFGMLIALILLLSYVGRSLRVPAAVLGGIGFGFFIDELGKFVTSDNDYFYKPAAAIIYIVFVVIFLATRAMRRRRGFTAREHLVNAAIAYVAQNGRRESISLHDVVIHGVRVRAITNSDHLIRFWRENWYSPEEWQQATGLVPPRVGE